MKESAQGHTARGPEHSRGGEARPPLPWALAVVLGGGPQCSEDGSPEPDVGRRKQRLGQPSPRGAGARAWGRAGLGKTRPAARAPHPKVVVKAGSQNEALGWEAQAHGGCWKENESRGSAGWPVPAILLGEGSTPAPAKEALPR